MNKFLCTLLLCILTVELTHAHELDRIDVTAALVDSPPTLSMAFDVANRSSQEVTLYKSNLPWGNLYSVTMLLIVPNRSETELQKALYFDDPGPDIVTIKPHSQMEGKINLLRLFPQIDQYRQQSDVLAFWAYRVKDVQGRVGNRVGGMLVIQQRKDKKGTETK